MIAILGWGSILWQRGPLALAGDWQPDGPRLPLEFARIAGDGRLTLVLYPQPGIPAVPTWWAPAAWTPLAAVVENLRDRARTMPGQIGSLPPHPAQTTFVAPEVTAAITAWRTAHGAEAVVWSNLPPNFTARQGGTPLTPDAAVAYLRGLRGAERRRAAEELRRVPATIATPVRQAVAAALGWTALCGRPARRSGCPCPGGGDGGPTTPGPTGPPPESRSTAAALARPAGGGRRAAGGMPLWPPERAQYEQEVAALTRDLDQA